MGMVLVLVLMLCACVTLSGACSCFPESGPQRFCRYDLIFRGTVLAEYEEREEPIDHSDPFWKYSPYRDWVYTIRVDHAVKMPEELKGAKMVTVRTPMQGSLCGTRFPVDVDAAFFAHVNEKGQAQTGLCDPNVPWEGLSDWDKELITDHIMDFCANRTEVVPPEP